MSEEKKDIIRMKLRFSKISLTDPIWIDGVEYIVSSITRGADTEYTLVERRRFDLSTRFCQKCSHTLLDCICNQ
jgi:hypothetical protein